MATEGARMDVDGVAAPAPAAAAAATAPTAPLAPEDKAKPATAPAKKGTPVDQVATELFTLAGCVAGRPSLPISRAWSWTGRLGVGRLGSRRGTGDGRWAGRPLRPGRAGLFGSVLSLPSRAQSHPCAATYSLQSCLGGHGQGRAREGRAGDEPST